MFSALSFRFSSLWSVDGDLGNLPLTGGENDGCVFFDTGFLTGVHFSELAFSGVGCINQLGSSEVEERILLS